MSSFCTRRTRNYIYYEESGITMKKLKYPPYYEILDFYMEQKEYGKVCKRKSTIVIKSRMSLNL